MWFLAIFAMASVTVQWAPALLGSRAPFLRDLLLFAAPVKAYWTERVLAGELPLWNPFVGNGMPFLADPANQVFYPLNVVFLAPWTSVFHALTTFVLAHMLLAVPSFAWLACRLGASSGLAWLAGAAFALSGYVLSISDSINYLPSVVFAPVVVAALIPPYDGFTTRRIAIAALGIAALVFGGTPLDAVFAVLTALFVSLGRCQTFGTVTVACISSLALGAALAAVQIFPTRELFPHSIRAEGLSLADAGALSLPPLRLFELIHPFVAGSPSHGEDALSAALYPRHNSAWAKSIYVGLVPVGLAIIGVIKDVGRAWPWVVVGALAVLLALGAHTPVFPVFREVLPMLDAFRYPEKFVFWVTVALLVLALLGAQRVAHWRVTRRKAVFVVTAGAVTIGLLADIPISVVFGDSSEQSSVFWSLLFFTELTHRSGAAVHVVTVTIAGITIYFATRRFLGVAPALMVLAVADLLFVHRGFPPLSRVNWDVIAETASDRIANLSHKVNTGRYPRIYYDEFVADDYLHRQASTRVPHSSLLGAGERVWEQISVMRLRRHHPLDSKVRTRYLNGRWSPLQTTRHFVFETLELPANPHRALSYASTDLVVSSIEPWNSMWDGGGFRELARDPIDNLRVLAVVGSLPWARWERPPGDASEVTRTKVTSPERIDVHVRNRGNQVKLLTVTETAYPGWTVSSDGVSHALEAGAHFLTVQVPQGEHTLRFSYRPPEVFLWGVAVTGFALLLTAALLLRWSGNEGEHP